MKYKILAVDDEAVNTRMLERVFRGEFDVVTAASGAEGLELLSVHDIALIISDQRMPGMTGVEFLTRAAVIRPHCVRIIITGYTDASDLADALNSNVVYKYISKPWINIELMQTVKRGLSHHETIKAQHQLNLENQRLRDRIADAENGVVRVLTEVLNLRSEDAVAHAIRTREVAEDIGRSLNLDSAAMKRLSLAAYLHEIANVKVPNTLLNKQSVLTPEEICEIGALREMGLQLLLGTPDLEEAATVLRLQNERYDGSGGPTGLIGEQIPLDSRILAVACAYEKMISSLPAGCGFTDLEARNTLQSEAGRQFDPDVVNVFCGLQSLNQMRGMISQSSLHVNG